METKYELRASFGDDACDIVASEDVEAIYLEQNDGVILIPRNHAEAFVKKLGDWLSYGRMA